MRATVITLVEEISRFPNSVSEVLSSLIQIYGGKKETYKADRNGKKCSEKNNSKIKIAVSHIQKKRLSLLKTLAALKRIFLPCPEQNRL